MKLRLFAMLVVVGMIACGKTYLHAAAAQNEGVTVQPMQVWIGGHKLWVRVNVVNEGSEPIVVDRDAVVARLPDGQAVGRSVGRTSLHGTYFIPPQSSHPVFVEFEETDFDWDRVGRATIDFTPGLRRGTQPIAMQLPVGL